jgi:hypothetical protein
MWLLGSVQLPRKPERRCTALAECGLFGLYLTNVKRHLFSSWQSVVCLVYNLTNVKRHFNSSEQCNQIADLVAWFRRHSRSGSVGPVLFFFLPVSLPTV